MSEMYVVFKLTSGEQVMAVLKEEDENYVLVEDPMCIKMIPLVEVGREQVMATPLCHFSDSHEYVIPKQNILFVKKLHASFVPHYKRLVAEHNETGFVPRLDQQENQAEDLDWEDDFTPETAKKAVEQLKNIFNQEEEEKEEVINWREKLKMLVPGNDTKH